MGELKVWIVNICTAVFFITAVEMILPDNNMKKYAKFVMGLILITVLINPLVMLLNNGDSINTFLDKSIGLIAEPDISVNNNLEQSNISATLRIFQKNLQDLSEKKLKEKFPKNEFAVQTVAQYNKEKQEYEVKKIEVEVRGSSGKVEKVKKVEINAKNNSPDNNRVESEISAEVKKFLSQELGLSEKTIYVYKAET
jgi:stage III sporulation protein AF